MTQKFSDNFISGLGEIISIKKCASSYAGGQPHRPYLVGRHSPAVDRVRTSCVVFYVVLINWTMLSKLSVDRPSTAHWAREANAVLSFNNLHGLIDSEA